MSAAQESVATALLASKGADAKKATDLALLDVSEVLRLVDIFVIASTANDRQLHSVADEIERMVRESEDRRPLRREGAPESGWMLLDYGDVVCHLFTEEQREYYALERLWSDVPRLDPITGASLSVGADTSELSTEPSRRDAVGDVMARQTGEPSA